MERPLGVSLIERRATGGDLPRGDLPQHSLADLRDPFTVPDPHLPRPRKDRSHLPLVTAEEVRELLFPEIFRLVRVHQDPVEVGEVGIAPRPFRDVPVQVAQASGGFRRDRVVRRLAEHGDHVRVAEHPLEDRVDDRLVHHVGAGGDSARGTPSGETRAGTPPVRSGTASSPPRGSPRPSRRGGLRTSDGRFRDGSLRPVRGRPPARRSSPSRGARRSARRRFRIFRDRSPPGSPGTGDP